MEREELIGQWSNPQASMALLPDSSFALVYGDVSATGAWMVVGDRLMLATATGEPIFLSLQQGILWLEELPFQRTPTPAPPKKKGRKPTPKATVAPARYLPPKLCGTWDCFKSGPVYGGTYHIHRVLQLNADGTFVFTKDNYNSGAFGQASAVTQETGQWWLEGSRLWFSSQEGQYFRQLDLQNARNGDPMIVLDGDNYVTKFKRPSW